MGSLRLMLEQFDGGAGNLEQVRMERRRDVIEIGRVVGDGE